MRRCLLVLTSVLTLATVVPAGYADELLPRADSGLPDVLDLEKGSKQGSPLDHLPPHITRLDLPAELSNAARPDWSPDGRRLVVLDALIGNVWEYDLRTAKAVNLTRELHPQDATRASYLSNGDLLVCAPPDRNPANPEGDRVRGELWLMPQPLGKTPLIRLGEQCWEGIAVSKQPGSTRIAWNRSNLDFTRPDFVAQVPTATSQIRTGRIDYNDPAGPRLVHKTLVVDRNDIPDNVIEVQDIRDLPDQDADTDDEFIFTAYGYRGGEVLGADLERRRIVDYSRSPWPEEAEGIDPAGRWGLVERSRSASSVGHTDGLVDIWRLALDGSGTFERLTFFTHYAGYGASNPVVSPDRTRFVFHLDRSDAAPGQSFGLLMFDLAAWDASGQGVAAPDPLLLPPR